MTRCKTGAWLDTLDADDQREFTIYTRRDKPISQLHAHCVTAGFTGGLTSTKDHAKRRCCCDR
ncbi:hypothetical protein 7S3_69 [uncultured Caudovirales phage]|uniref:Uncharacterized protein n=1 Tax=uncultured Caudovirales phage TaxID=2100421 RepID=A0A2H4J7D1_9CAUD|nr:hypothetical protein 7S3_69 [uncultured Caudovirales phage]